MSVRASNEKMARKKLLRDLSRDGGWEVKWYIRLISVGEPSDRAEDII